MEESGSEGLEEALKKKKSTFLKDVNYTCISDNYWLGKTKPCITYGLRYVSRRKKMIKKYVAGKSF